MTLNTPRILLGYGTSTPSLLIIIISLKKIDGCRFAKQETKAVGLIDWINNNNKKGEAILNRAIIEFYVIYFIHNKYKNLNISIIESENPFEEEY